MKAKDFAQSIFDRIGDGHKNAVARPENPIADRMLRQLIEKANLNGDVIISGISGYYRPIPGNVVDDMEYKAYIAKETARAESIWVKLECMKIAHRHRALEVEYGSEILDSGKAAGES